MQPGLISQALLFSSCDRTLVTGCEAWTDVGLRLQAGARQLRAVVVICEAFCSGLINVLHILIIANLLWPGFLG